MNRARPHLLALLAGAVFGVGLALAGMTQPSKVVGFLDLFGDWDPSLAFVMGGAVAVYLPVYRLITKRSAPILAPRFLLPTRTDLDGRLIAGAAMFGVGWGLGGYCPGPAITSVGALAPSALLFAAAMFGGFGLFAAYDHLRRALAAPRDETAPEGKA